MLEGAGEILGDKLGWSEGIEDVLGDREGRDDGALLGAVLKLGSDDGCG